MHTCGPHTDTEWPGPPASTNVAIKLCHSSKRLFALTPRKRGLSKATGRNHRRLASPPQKTETFSWNRANHFCQTGGAHECQKPFVFIYVHMNHSKHALCVGVCKVFMELIGQCFYRALRKGKQVGGNYAEIQYAKKSKQKKEILLQLKDKNLLLIPSFFKDRTMLTAHDWWQSCIKIQKIWISDFLLNKVFKSFHNFLRYLEGKTL